MKNLYITASLFVFLLIFSAFVFLPKSEAQNNVLYNLLSLPAPPPPNPDFVVYAGNTSSRSAEFYSRKNPPSEDAPIDELMDYWQRQNGYDPTRAFTAKPSDKTLNRIFGELEKHPEKLGEFLNVLSTKPEAAERVKRIYETMKAGDDPENYMRSSVEAWLAYNTKYKIEELAAAAGGARDTDQYVTNQDEVLALARVDWERARPMLERMAADSTQPISQTLARWALLEHAVREGNSIEADRYRDELKARVENKSAKPGDRDLAMDALVRTGDFPGRDDWYFSLLDDDTLHDLRVNGQSYTGLTTILNLSDPEKYVAKMIEFVRGGSPNQRAAAIRNLATVIDENNPEVVRVMLPWLENPAWAKDINSSRRSLVAALAEIEMPESVPGLIAILDEKIPTGSSSVDANSSINANVINSLDYDSEETYPYRYFAITALAKQKSLQAVPALRRVLPDVEPWQRETVVRAILESGGFSVGEQVDALAFVAESMKEELQTGDDKMMDDYYEGSSMTNMAVTTTKSNGSVQDSPPPPPPPVPMGMGRGSGSGSGYSVGIANKAYGASVREKEIFNPADIIPLLGVQVASISEPSGELVSAVVERISRLENTKPEVANALRKIIESWNGPAINALMLTDLGKGKADADVVVKLLSLRKELREKQQNDVFAARNSNNPIALGITACILENPSEYDQILGSDSIEMKIALLSCARLIRAKLPVQTVGKLLKNPNNVLAKAAELYLESEDSPEARNLIYALYPNKAKILGATAFFAPDRIKLGNQEFLSALFVSVNEKYVLPPYMLYNVLAEQGIMQAAERKLQQEITETNDILGIYAYNENFVRIYADKALFSWSENDARFRERTLNQQEFDYLKNYLAGNNVSNLPPFIGDCGDCQSRELLMLGANGGRRIYVKSETMPEFFDGLDKIFEAMRRPPAKLKYHLEKNVAGLEILYADDKLPAKTIWKNGAEMSLLIEDTERRTQIDEELRIAAAAAYERLDDDNYDEYEKLETESRKRQMMRAFEEFSWRGLRDGQLGDFIGQPPGFEAIPRKDNSSVPANSEQWKRRAGNVEIRNDADGIYRVKGTQTVKLQSGFYHSAVLTADGRWVIAGKYDNETDSHQLFRINPQTGAETLIKMPENAGLISPIAFVPSLNKMLVSIGGYYDYENERMAEGNYVLLDVATGALSPIKGEVRPLVQQSFRPLQTNGKPDEFWAAIPDGKENTQVGVYNSKTLTFTPILKIPRIGFDSMDMWVDEPGNKVYFVYQGQVLALPLRTQAEIRQ